MVIQICQILCILCICEPALKDAKIVNQEQQELQLNRILFAPTQPWSGADTWHLTKIEMSSMKAINNDTISSKSLVLMC